MALDDAYERLVVFDNMLTDIARLEPGGGERTADVADRPFGTVDDDPDLTGLQSFDAADHELGGGELSELGVSGVAVERHVDDFARERRATQVLRRVEQQQLTVAQQA